MVKGICSVGVMASILCATEAAAQGQLESPAQPETSSTIAQPEAVRPAPGNVFSEIVVTAQRRAERAQDVPISLLAFNEATLETANVQSIGDLPRIAPSLQFSKSAFSASSKVQIRGIGSPGNTSVEPSVAVFLDGIYVPRPGSIIGAFLDIESIEVLRGPQGTLFGRNASAGAVVMNSATPKDYFEGMVKAEVGSGDRYRLEGMVNIPLSDSGAIRIAGLGQLFGGLYHNEFDGDQVGGLDTYSGRISGRFDLSDSIEWTLRGDYTSMRGDGLAVLEFEQDSVSPGRLATFRQRAGGEIGDLNIFDRTINQFADSYLHDSHWGLASDLNVDIGGGFSVRWLAGHRVWKNDNFVETVTWVPSPDVGFRQKFRSESTSTELQLLSPEDELVDGRLSFVLGGYYYHEKYDIGEQIFLRDAFCTGVLSFNVPPPVVGLCLNGGPRDPATNYDFAQKTDSAALFGQASFDLTDTIELVGGIRWTSDKKDASFVQQVFNPVAGNFRAAESTDADFSRSRFSYRANLNFRPTRDHLLFASYSTGFKSGGVDNGGNATALGQARLFDAETTENIEIGAKTSWLDNALTFNLTFYRMDINGYQDRRFDGLSFSIGNAGSLRNQGFEIDGTINPDPHLSFQYGVAYLDSEFLSYPDAPGLPGIGGTQDLAGQPNLYSPEWTVTGGVQYTDDIGEDLSWTLGTNFSLVSDAFIGGITDASPQTIQDGYVVVNIRAELSGPDDRWSVAVFGDNINDAKFCAVKTYQFLDSLYGLRDPVTGFSGINCNAPSQRTYGVNATLRF